jgi:hypothetical protein
MTTFWETMLLLTLKKTKCSIIFYIGVGNGTGTEIFTKSETETEPEPSLPSLRKIYVFLYFRFLPSELSFEWKRQKFAS